MSIHANLKNGETEAGTAGLYHYVREKGTDYKKVHVYIIMNHNLFIISFKCNAKHELVFL